MKCFYHPDNDAIGICYHCGRGLCAECAAEYPRALACKGHCERAVELMLLSRDKQLYMGKFQLRARKRKPFPPVVKRGLIYALFALPIIALVAAQFYYTPPQRTEISLSLCGIFLAMLIPVYINHWRRNGGGQ